MFHPIRLILRRPSLLLLAVMTFIHGSAYGSTLPYLSITAINELGISDQAYSVLMFVTSLSTVLISVSLGVISDFTGDRRKIMVALASIGVIAYGAIFIFPSRYVFVCATALAIPFFQSVSSFIFISVRAETADLTSQDSAAVNTTMRAFMSASWVVMPGTVGFAFAGSGSMRGAWGVAGLCALAILFCSAFLLRKSRDQRAGMSGGAFFSALKEIAAPLMLARMISMASLTGTTRLASTLWPLILMIKLGGKSADVGMVAGLIALLEIPFMLIWAALLTRISLLAILVMGGVIYGGYMALLSFTTAPWQFYLLALPAAAGAAALLSMPLTYFQQLFPDRPGLGTAFNPINSCLANGLMAIMFAFGAPFFGYSGTAWLGVTMAAAGIGGLLVLGAVRSST
ncbi:MFS transporter [Rhizobium sp. BK491]|uniref:MFS transporter n=1 Tax=Rhizobium sp. BK491 TaxID=2587009 RepID=UPI0016181D73|nr:MFS transporter [Rhizobium sp. BK491]MBB3571248.1 hypothetical protein [Rhizobium sp. BK491]